MRSWNTVRVSFAVLVLVLLAAAPSQAQDGGSPTPLTVVTRETRRPLPTTVSGGREYVALEDVARLFGLQVREDALAGGVTATYLGRSIVLSANRQMVSVDGRISTLPASVVQSGGQWLVPIEFLSGPLASVYDQRIELRRASRLLLVGPVRLPRVSASIDTEGPPTRATITIAPATEATVTSEGDRIVVRIDADSLDLALPPAGDGLIDAFAAGGQPNVVVVALSADAGTGRATVTSTANATRITLDIPGRTVAGPPVDSRPPARGSRLPEPSSRLPAPGSRLPEPAPLIPDPGPRRWQTIVIDAGHGGDDTGVRGARGLEEKDVTLDVARRLRTLVEARLGLRVILTRDGDRALTLDERAAVANNSKADLLLSLHVNGTISSSPSGAEVLYLQLDREDEDVRRATAVNDVVLPALSGGPRRLALIPWDLAQARYVESSAVLAAVLSDELRRQIPMSPRSVRQGPMRLLAAANMPAAVVEMGYATNPAQERRLRSDEFRASVAQALFNAIVRFRTWTEERTAP